MAGGISGGIMQTNSFRLVTTGSIIGLGAITLLVTSKATFDQAAWWNVERQKTQAFSDKAVADAYQKNQIVTFDSLIISDYTLNSTPPRIDWHRSVDATRKTIIYDKYRRCVGYALNGKFFFTRYYKGVCD
jgi:hypothetical protein